MSDLRLSWMRDQDGVIVVYLTDDTGRKVALADIWSGTMRQHMGYSADVAKRIQQQIAETLVWNWNGAEEKKEPREGNHHDD